MVFEKFIAELEKTLNILNDLFKKIVGINEQNGKKISKEQKENLDKIIHDLNKLIDSLYDQ